MCAARVPCPRRLAFCTAAALLSLAIPIVAAELIQYKTEILKGAACAKENKPLGPFYIPDNQCTGALYDLSHDCDRVELVRISVNDYAHVKLSIDDSLQWASVERARNLAGECPGRAIVRAALACRHNHTQFNQADILPPL